MTNPFHFEKMTDDFQVVKYKKKNKSKARVDPTAAYSTNPSNQCEDVDIPRCIRRLTDARNDLTSTEFYSSVRDSVERVFECIESSEPRKLKSEVICYGLGNISECVIARYQLCLLLALREHLQIDASDCHLYDPRFKLGEINLLRELGLGVIERNEEGKRPCAMDTRTLFYMPHCGKSLCNNLLWANWDKHHLTHMVVIGNSFSTILNNSPSRILERTCGYLQRIHPYCVEVPLPTTFHYKDIFNDTAIHSFPGDKLNMAPEEFWENPSEPHYEEEDIEFIPNKDPT